MDSIPKILYKYCNRWGIDILQYRRLKITPFNEFNDPFELAPRMRPDFNIEDARALTRDLGFQRALYERTVALGQFPGSFDAFAEMLAGMKPDLASKLVEDHPKAAAEFRLSHMGTTSKEFGLICLSEVPDDILMWSHYTKGHTGFVIGFDTANEFFAQPPVHQVDYKEERVLMGLVADLCEAPPRLAEIITALIKTKSRDWFYEREWRQLHNLAQCLSCRDPQRGNKLVHHKVISPAAICEVIRGSRCDSAHLNELLAQREFAHVKCRRARIHDTDFKLVLEDV